MDYKLRITRNEYTPKKRKTKKIFEFFGGSLGKQKLALSCELFDLLWGSDKRINSVRRIFFLSHDYFQSYLCKVFLHLRNNSHIAVMPQPYLGWLDYWMVILLPHQGHQNVDMYLT